MACLLWLSIVATAANAQVTVAFTGDQGTGDSARAVLQLIEDEGADLLLIQGDLGYGSRSADQWIENIDGILGSDFPVLLSVGNHENHEWPEYQRWLLQRIVDLPELICEGNPGVKAHCTFRGISIVQVAQGVDEVEGVAARDDYAQYLDQELADASNVWRICSWHKNQKSMQVGGKNDETGWDVYAACLKNGAIVATAHEHSYSRTYSMTDFENKVLAHRNNLLEVGPGRSFAFVSGLGGINIRKQRRAGHWWASVYTANQQATYGALFCTFEDKDADCRFKAVNGYVPDEFALKNVNVAGDKQVIEDVKLMKGGKGLFNTGSLEGKGGFALFTFMCVMIGFRRLGPNA